MFPLFLKEISTPATKETHYTFSYAKTIGNIIGEYFIWNSWKTCIYRTHILQKDSFRSFIYSSIKQKKFL